jgi:hypothetical protein
VSDLERELADLAPHLDVTTAGDWQTDLTRRLTAPTPIHRRNRRPALVGAAAAIAVAAAGVVAVAPARSAVAGWLGIGAVEVSQGPPPATSSPPAPTTTRPPLDLTAAQRLVAFEITPPSGAGEPSRITVDRRVPGGLVTLTYDDYTVVEVATDPDEPTIAKFIEGGTIEDVVVHGHAGMWIPEAHRIGYIDRSGKLDFDTLRRAGPVLLWSVDDVTFRVEGPPTLDQAMAVANTIV